jgi:hypothetical protein
MMGDKRNCAAGVKLLQDPDDIDRRNETMAIRARMELSQDIKGTSTLFLAFELGGWHIAPRPQHWRGASPPGTAGAGGSDVAGRD